jgi:hypothetical protein
MRKLNIILIPILIFTINDVAGQITFWENMFLYYPLNGNTLDYSGFNNHGNTVGINYGTGIFNDENGAAKLNGTDSYVYRQYLNLPDSSTLSGWFYSESDSQATALIYNGNTGSNGYGVFIKKPFGNSTTGYFGKKVVVVQGGISENTFNGQYDFPKNQWIHLVLVRRGPIYELYLNGEYQTTGQFNANTPTNNFCLGSTPEHIQAGYPSFYGKIDEVMLFKSALQPQDVQKVFQANLTRNLNLQSSDKNIILYPNPTNQQTVKISSDIKIISISIHNSLGDLIDKIEPKNSTQPSIITDQLKKGIYNITLESEKGIITKKIAVY